MRSLLVAVIALALLVAGAQASTPDHAESSSTSLRFSFTGVDGVGIVRCERRTASSTRQGRAPGAIVCPRLALADLRPSAQRACAALYGGPERVTVTGTLAGRRVRTTVRRTNSCEIARWQRTGARVLRAWRLASAR